MTIYTRAQALTARQMASKGQLGAVRRTVTTGGGPSDPTGGSTATTDYPARMALFTIDQSDVDGTFIKAGDWRVILSGEEPSDAADWDDGHSTASIEGITPTTTDLLVTDEGILTIINPGKSSPAGTVTHYKMVARK